MYPQQPAPGYYYPPAPPRKRMGRAIALLFVGLLLLIVGYNAGVSAHAAPATVTTTTTVTPQVCVDAMGNADAVIADAGQGFQDSADGFNAASRFDVAGVNSAHDSMVALKPTMDADIAKYISTRNACRASAH